MPHRKIFTPAEDRVLLQLLVATPPARILSLIAFLIIKDNPDREAIVRRLLANQL